MALDAALYSAYTINVERKTIHVRVDDEVLAWLQTETERQERTVSFLVGKILREAMGKKVGKA